MMLRQVPRAALRNLGGRVIAEFRPSSARVRLRRRLYVFSAPVAILVLLAAFKMIAVGVVGDRTIADFDRHDIEALRHDLSSLGIFDVIDPAKTSFAAGDLSVLEGRLHEADDHFSQSLTRTGKGQSCPVRINLLLVRETLGDLATRAGNRDEVARLYTDAIALASDAPPACFAGNTDPNPDRRAIRNSAITRLQQKLDALHAPPGAPPLPAATVTRQPPPTSLTPASSAPPIPGLPSSSPPSSSPSPSSPSPSSPPAPQPATGNGPGPNMPELPQTGTADIPVVGPDNVNDDPNAGGVLNPVSPDRIPIAGNGGVLGHRLGTGDPMDLLRRLLDNSNAYGDNQE